MEEIIPLVFVVIFFILVKTGNNKDENEVEKAWENYLKQNPLSELDYQKFRDEYFYPKSDAKYNTKKIIRIVTILGALFYFLFIFYIFISLFLP
ncbi:MULTISPECIES: hypothetical protein [unclassified Lactococcus]|uniref:hypothetical protein n=1 Tax=unclassified Lactococcus TaxID=2643510 RepID=UPI0011CA14CF|nr:MULTISPECIES: hypothetical protein [unclassified Lactococcus]MQW24074.1 hypothetical protein [Lactococcus sp. dk101]TXK36737.1 hypothetical protein FVP42_10855 [Lactococcus sp. dk310]TXK36744.1 hypothetical protein FVP42_10890 [Lactococcus sp. dk310]TXK46077.1 hypothetical protein FVP43_11135 [Lactococcus sp. dk322]